MSLLKKLKTDGSPYNGDLKGGLPQGSLQKDAAVSLDGFDTFSKGQYQNYVLDTDLAKAIDPTRPE
jgi:hypothetical protein